MALQGFKQVFPKPYLDMPGIEPIMESRYSSTEPQTFRGAECNTKDTASEIELLGVANTSQLIKDKPKRAFILSYSSFRKTVSKVEALCTRKALHSMNGAYCSGMLQLLLTPNLHCAIL